MSRMLSRRGNDAPTRRSRSRSRTPPVRPKPKTVVNMLDSSALSQAKEVRRKPMMERVSGGGPPAGFDRRFVRPDVRPAADDRHTETTGPERITCTIEGSGARRSVFNRVSGGRFESGGRFDANRSFEGGNRGGGGGGGGGFDGNRSFNGGPRRVDVAHFEGLRRSFPDRSEGRRSLPDRTQRDDEGGFGRRGEEDDKPVMKLVDPQEVPRSNRFFTHDDRGGDTNEWHGRDMYDPRKDTSRYDRGGRFDRERRDYGNRDFGGRDYGNRRFDRSDDRDNRRSGGERGAWDGFSRQNVNGYTGSRFGERSGADGVWVHDKYLDLMTEDEEKPLPWIEGDEKKDEGGKEEDDDAVLVVDTVKTERTVEE